MDHKETDIMPLADFITERKKTREVLILGHRGCRKADIPENTMAAFGRALESGADGIEIDVETTSDGKLVVVNRWFLNHNFGFFPWERSLEAIRKHGREMGISVPGFDEVCRLIKAHPSAVINVEIKSSDRLLCRTARMAGEEIRRHGIGKRVVVSSFDVNTLLTMRWKHPAIERAYLFRTEDRVVNLKEKKSFLYKLSGMINRSGIKAWVARADTLHPEISLIPKTKRPLWARCAALTGKRINTWTVDSEEEFARARNFGADMVISDNPVEMVRIRKKRAQLSPPPQPISG